MSNSDAVRQPKHYRNSNAKCSACQHPIECIDVVRGLEFNIGNAIKYIWRFKEKNGIEDLQKAIWYLEDYIGYVLDQKSIVDSSRHKMDLGYLNNVESTSTS